MTGRIDLNSDVGEGFGRWSLGDDADMLVSVTSANIACGFHAGDPRGIRRTAAIAVARGVAIGAHVGYRDLAGFGRRNLDVDSADLVPELIYQIGALGALAAAAGGRVAYVKPHGALYNTIVHDERQAADVVEAIRSVDPALVVLGLPGSAVLRLADAAGLPTAAEAFADRAYAPDGTLVPRSEPGSIIHDAAAVADRVLRLVEEGRVEAIDGTLVPVRVDSVCIHSDTDGALALAAAVRARLDASGATVTPFTAP